MRALPSRALLALLPLLALGTATASCRSTSPPGAMLCTTPPGARVRIEGRDSGFVTPCMVDVGSGRVEVELELAGYEPARLVLAPARDVEFVSWTHGAPSPSGSLRQPLGLEAGDLFFPVRIDRGQAPQRVHVALRAVEPE